MTAIRNIEGLGGLGEASRVSPLSSPALPLDTDAVRDAAGGVSGPSFGGILEELVAQASTQAETAQTKAQLVAQGSLDDLHGTMIAVKEAEISLKLVGSVRNKLIDAFQEIWRTNV